MTDTAAAQRTREIHARLVEIIATARAEGRLEAFERMWSERRS